MVILIGILFILAAIAYWKKIPYSYGSLLYSLSSVFIIAINLALLFRLLNRPFEHYYESIEGQLLLLVWCFNTFELIWSSKAMSRFFSAIMVFIILKLVSYLSVELYIPDDLILMLKPKWLDLSNNLMLVSYFILVFGSFLSTTLFIYIVVFLVTDSEVKNKKYLSKSISMSQLTSIFNEFFIDGKKPRKEKKNKKDKNKSTENEDEIFDQTFLVELLRKNKDKVFNQISLLELIANVEKKELAEFEEKKEEQSTEKKKKNKEKNKSTEKKKDLFDQISLSEWKAIMNRVKIIQRREKRVQIFDTLSTYSIIIGHISLTVSILMGAIGAKEIFNVYWSWNSKEVWSLVLWLMFTLYLHVSFIRKGSSFQKAGFGSIGFGIIWISYFYVKSFLIG